MIKLLNYLFGWDYIYWANWADHGISRVLRDAEGNPYYYRYKATKVIDKIIIARQVIWLTCLPSKYMKGENEN